MQHNIYILTGEIQTGKTTALIKFCSERENVQGILSPVVNGKRMVMNIVSKQMFKMEADEEDINVLKIGRFAFKNSVFEKAKEIIADASNYNYLVIDEVGPLELRKEGLYSTIQQSLNEQDGNIILVVREGLVEQVVEFFSIENPMIISKTILESL